MRDSGNLCRNFRAPRGTGLPWRCQYRKTSFSVAGGQCDQIIEKIRPTFDNVAKTATKISKINLKV